MKFKQKLVSVALVLGLITESRLVPLADRQRLEVHHINVGQVESIYIEFPDGTDDLIDAGKSNYGDTVANYLKSQESNIDLEYLIATHPEADHIGGMQSVLKDLNVKNFIYPKDTRNKSNTWQAVLSLANKQGCTINDSTLGSTFDIGGATMKFIQSPKNFTDNNDDSVVTYLDIKIQNSYLQVI
ncbi:MBL fold metallo-hydrolase [Paraclostridium ghonii]|uniref:MBL fold metallo-hydrolase n=1 Tax=Paraclostridium ghonii TaxID=29358 RepID=UPI00202CC652|nr:MBL fold metallo-hydrolase [Paeniclostridium ghonii]MCM0167651.1 MBL fold metallo-hydrolase [Paeniclostridium ghonii]